VLAAGGRMPKDEVGTPGERDDPSC
jgi:hypothetical protein